MDLDQLKNNWQDQELKMDDDSQTYDKVIALDKSLERENLWVSIFFSSTIFILGFVLLPFLRSATEQLLIGSLMFLMGFQAFLFWMRSLNVRKSFSKAPRIYIKSLIRKLKYNLSVTKFIMPLYMILLGTIISFYTYELLSSFEVELSYIVIGIAFIWCYLLGVFIYGWRKQRKKDQGIIIPMIAELEETVRSY